MKLRLKPLADQVIVVTGASSGIGLVTARAAAARGATVFLIARDSVALADAVRGIEASGGKAAYATADVGDIDLLRAAAESAVATFGRIDTWVTNAGVAIYGALLDVPLADHRRLFDTNYFGAVHGAMVAVPHLKRQGGALITVGSVVSDMTTPIMGIYAASKHAVKGYIGALRIELQASGDPISVSLIKPSGIDTPIAKHALNLVGGEARIPPPAYDPSLVAAAILEAAERPLREVTVGGAGRLQSLFAEHFPAAFDRIAPLGAKTFTDDAKPQPGPNNLFRSERTGDERSGNTTARRSSLYTGARLRPRLATLVASVGVGLFTLAARRRHR